MLSASDYEDFEKLKQACIDEGLLKRGLFGRLKVTDQGWRVIELAATVDEGVQESIEVAERAPRFERRSARAALVLVARNRLTSHEDAR